MKLLWNIKDIDRRLVMIARLLVGDSSHSRVSSKRLIRSVLLIRLTIT